ncbi:MULTISPECIES: hypothetical protein [Pseudomonas]|jgi:hypothetical protein|uniref:Uncharacterized protein n=1 Tax=Pseudomonas khavaziana TaxID=2842351 RepID=A0ABZ2DCQ3_9PSED|nr:MULTISPECIES: hypothetical protein [Pseudomonas]MBK3442886.1 hypothetical protein [Pseudomonas lactis]WHT78583.1 hypothetical protein QMY54_03368 [Pseudomonas rhodesiae]
MTQLTLEKIQELEGQIGRKLSDLELALWVQFPFISVEDFIHGINFQSLIEWLSEKLGRPLTLVEMQLAASLLRKGHTNEDILDAIHPPAHKIKLPKIKP